MNLAWAKEFVSNWTPSGVEKTMAAYADEIVFQDMASGHKVSGKDGVRKMFEGMSAPNAGEHVFTVTGWNGGPEGGALEWTWQSKHASDFLGAPAKGKETSVAGTSVLTFKNGKIIAQRDYWDTATVLRQLGAIK
jgi:steroid delta-isomerase-like uncharacterized protein